MRPGVKRTALRVTIGVLLLAGPSRGDDLDRYSRFAACFDFGALVRGGTVTPQWLDDGDFWFVDAGHETLRVDHDTAEKRAWSPPPPAPAESEPLARLVTVEYDLWLVDGDSTRLTFDGTEERPWIAWSANWSADRHHVAVERYDLRGTPTIPIVDWLDPDAPVERQPATRARDPRPRGTPFVVDVRTHRLVEVRFDDGFAEPANLFAGWAPTGELLVVRFDRRMQHRRLLAADPATGSTRSLIEEHRDTFIDGLAFASLFPHYLTDVGDQAHFLWLSERDGFHHLYLYDYAGTLVRQVTRGRFPVDAVHGVHDGYAYVTARTDPDDPTSQHVARARLGGGGVQTLTALPGRRTVHFAPDWSCFVENHSDLDRPPRADLRRVDGTLIGTVETSTTPELQRWGWQPPQRALARAADGRSPVFAALWLPPQFDPRLRYPVIEVIYAGPQWMIVPRRFVAGEYGDTAAALAQLGYVTVILDGPGTAGVGKDYQDRVYGRLGQFEIDDHVAALRDLAATRPWMDLDRVGVHGKSWGGYFTLRAMLLAPDLYRVGVASAAVADLTTTAESPVVPYLGLPADDPQAYAAADCLPLAQRLSGKLLITSGTADRNTPFGQTMRMLDAFATADRDVELLVFPGQDHWLHDKSFARWQRGLADFFLEHLPPLALSP